MGYQLIFINNILVGHNNYIKTLDENQVSLLRGLPLYIPKVRIIKLWIFTCKYSTGDWSRFNCSAEC